MHGAFRIGCHFEEKKEKNYGAAARFNVLQRYINPYALCSVLCDCNAGAAGYMR